MNVHCNQHGLLKPCPEHLIHRGQKAFGQTPVKLRRINPASPQPCRRTLCQLATKLPADQVKHHPGAVT